MFHGGAKLLIILSALVICQEVNGARILGIWAFAGKSHTHMFTTLATELAKRGHELVTITPFPMNKNIPNYTEIFTKEVHEYITNKMDMMEQRNKNFFYLLVDSMREFLALCDKGLDQPEIKELINSSDDKKFDLIIISIFLNDCYLGFAHKYQAPVIFISPSGPMFGTHEFVGGLEPWSHIPIAMFPFTDRMNFQERFINTVSGILFKALRWFINYVHDGSMRRHFGPDLPFLGDIQRNTSLMLLNSHVSTSYSRPTVPNMIDVGGMHLRPAKDLPKDLKTFLDDAKEGAIYFSLGSNVRSDKMPPEKLQIFLEVFGQLPQKVLWKWESDTLPGQPKNVKIGKWLPQQDILAHPNIRVFITHGGLFSTQETVYHGIPVIGIPIFADQELNMQNAVNQGLGLKLDLNTLTKESLLETLNEVIHNSSYRENVKRLSAVFKDQPETPLERAVFWTEYVLRHNGARHLRSGSMELSWYQYFLLDVFAVLFLILGLVATLIYLALRTLYRCIRKDKKKLKKS